MACNLYARTEFNLHNNSIMYFQATECQVVQPGSHFTNRGYLNQYSVYDMVKQ